MKGVYHEEYLIPIEIYRSGTVNSVSYNMIYDAHADHKMPAADQSVLVKLKPTRLARVHRADRRVGIFRK